MGFGDRDVSSSLDEMFDFDHDDRIDAAEAAIYEQMCLQPEFGNGRFARNMLERARMKQSLRLSKMDVEKVTKTDVTRLVADDFELPAVLEYEGKGINNAHVIGF